MEKKFALIFGTRPEIIKMAPFIKEAKKQGLDFFIIHTGQHYSEMLDKVFWDNFALEMPKYNLGIGSGTHAEQVGKMLIEIEKVLMKERPDMVCVYADLNSSIAGALAAAKLSIPIVQLEAGLRSFDKRMPEEVNRLMVDSTADYFFAPTKLQKQHLENEGKTKNVYIVGNMVADAIMMVLEKALRESRILPVHGLLAGNYFLLTSHRPAMVDNKENFSNMLKGMDLIHKEYGLPIIYPIHPRAKKNLENFSIDVPAGVRLTEPANYYDFLTLQHNAKLIFSDSGGLQEEAAILKVPLVTLRENTERQETLALGCNILAGFDPENILRCARLQLLKDRNWQHPYGGGDTAEKIVSVLKNL